MATYTYAEIVVVNKIFIPVGARTMLAIVRADIYFGYKKNTMYEIHFVVSIAYFLCLFFFEIPSIILTFVVIGPIWKSPVWSWKEEALMMCLVAHERL